MTILAGTQTESIYTAQELASVSTLVPYELQTGSPFVAGMFYNLSPYFLQLSETQNGTPYFIISPWSITPVNFSYVNQFVSLETTIPAIDVNQPALQANQYVKVVLYQTPLNIPTTLLTQGATQTADVSQVNINNNNLNVTTQAGSQTTVAGTVDIGNTPAVTVTSGTVDIASGTVDVTMTGSTVTQDANVINDIIPTSPTTSGTITQSLNIAAGASGFLMISIPLSLYDGCTVYLYSPSNQFTNITVTLNQIRYQTTGGATFRSPINNVFVFDESYDNKTQSLLSEFFSWEKEFQCNMLYIGINNLGTSPIIDTITVTVYPRYASQTIVNPSSSPVNTQGVHGSPTASGITYLSSANSYLVTFLKLANLVVTKIIVSGQWQGSATATTSVLGISTGGNTIATYPLTGTGAGDYFQPINLDLGQGITLGSDGITIHETGEQYDMQIVVFVIFKRVTV